MTGVEAFLEVLAGAGAKYLFGNPGTTELPLNDALVDDRRFQYILGLQEVPVMAMADWMPWPREGGRGQPAHLVRPGQRDGHALQRLSRRDAAVVTAGQQDRRLKFEEPILCGDMVERGPALDEVVGRSGARRGPAHRRSPRRCRRRSRRRRARSSCRCRSTCRWKQADELDLSPPSRARSARAAAAPRRCAAPPGCSRTARRARRSWRAAASTEADAVGGAGRRGRAARRARSFAEVGHDARPAAVSRRSPAVRARACRCGRRRSSAARTSTTCCWSSAWTCCGVRLPRAGPGDSRTHSPGASG